MARTVFWVGRRGRSCDSTLSDETAVGGGLGSGALGTGPSSGPKSTPFHHHPPGQPWRPPPTPGGHHHCSTAVAATLQVHPLTATATATATARPLSHRRRVASATSSTTHALETLWERGPRQNHALILPPRARARVCSPGSGEPSGVESCRCARATTAGCASLGRGRILPWSARTRGATADG